MTANPENDIEASSTGPDLSQRPVAQKVGSKPQAIKFLRRQSGLIHTWLKAR